MFETCLDGVRIMFNKIYKSELMMLLCIFGHGDDDGEEDDDDHGGACDHCLKRFDKQSQFIRHVTHSKICLDSYDPKVIADIKHESRLRTKRNWFKRNWASRIKEERKAKAGKIEKQKPNLA